MSSDAGVTGGVLGFCSRHVTGAHFQTDSCIGFIALPVLAPPPIPAPQVACGHNIGVPCLTCLRTSARILREILFLRHGCTGAALYGDDGELQCKACGIDFARQSAEEIRTRFAELGLAQLAKAQQEISGRSTT